MNDSRRTGERIYPTPEGIFLGNVILNEKTNKLELDLSDGENILQDVLAALHTYSQLSHKTVFSSGDVDIIVAHKEYDI